MSYKTRPVVTSSSNDAYATDIRREKILDSLWQSNISNNQIEAFIRNAKSTIAKPTLSHAEREEIAREYSWIFAAGEVTRSQAELALRKAIDAALQKAGVGGE